MNEIGPFISDLQDNKELILNFSFPNLLLVSYEYFNVISHLYGPVNHSLGNGMFYMQTLFGISSGDGSKKAFVSFLLFQHNCFCFRFTESKSCVSYFIPLHSIETLWSRSMQPLLRSVDTVTDAPPCRAMCQQLYLRQFHLEHRCQVWEMGQKSD